MFEHYTELAKYWRNVALGHSAAGYYHLAALYQDFSERHMRSALEHAE